MNKRFFLCAGIALAVYWMLPDIGLSKTQIVLMLITFWVCSMIAWRYIEEAVERIRAKRASLCIRKKRQKRIDFPMRRVIRIPAYKVVGE